MEQNVITQEARGQQEGSTRIVYQKDNDNRALLLSTLRGAEAENDG